MSLAFTLARFVMWKPFVSCDLLVAPLEDVKKLPASVGNFFLMVVVGDDTILAFFEVTY
jgi:hypothetical protein